MYEVREKEADLCQGDIINSEALEHLQERYEATKTTWQAERTSNHSAL
jgi:hypothetical protein